MSYRLGRKPGVIPVGLEWIEHYFAGKLPKPPASVAVPAVADWGMLGNDQYGDCGVAGLEHGFMAAASDVKKAEPFPSAQDAISYYLDYDNGQDEGVVLSQYLAYVKQNGYYGEKVSAYAPVAVHKIPTLQFAIDAYDFAYIGITVTQGMMDAVQFSDTWTWDMTSLQGDTLGGHCIVLVGYDSRWLYGITWGRVIRIAYPAYHQMTDEVWCVLTGEIESAGTDGHGLSLKALQADLSRLR